MTHTYHADCECTECRERDLWPAPVRHHPGGFVIVLVACVLSTVSLMFASALVSYLMFFR
jgi:hypothetical protein